MQNVSSPSSTAPQISLNYDEISARAYELWEKEGRPDNRDQEIWFKAETQLREEHRAPEPASIPSAENVPVTELSTSAPLSESSSLGATKSKTRSSKSGPRGGK